LPKQRFSKKILLRKLFNAYFLGDRVKIKDLDNRKGRIVSRRWVGPNMFDPNPHWEYEVEFDQTMRLEIYLPGQKRCGGLCGLHFEDLELI